MQRRVSEPGWWERAVVLAAFVCLVAGSEVGGNFAYRRQKKKCCFKNVRYITSKKPGQVYDKLSVLLDEHLEAVESAEGRTEGKNRTKALAEEVSQQEWLGDIGGGDSGGGE